jgi:hypothetical protein
MCEIKEMVKKREWKMENASNCGRFQGVLRSFNLEFVFEERLQKWGSLYQICSFQQSVSLIGSI